MIVGVTKEIKNHEYRVGLTPSSVREFVAAGHRVLVETEAGAGIGASDDAYRAVGATIVPEAATIFADAEMVVKVKEPQPDECSQLHEDQLLFTYLHLAPDLIQTELLLESGVTAVAYETVTGADGSLPLLAPMSEVAGRLAAQAGAHCLERASGGSGVLLGGVPGTPPGRVLVLGGGVVGENAAYIATGMGAQVTILDRSLPRLRQLDIDYEGRVSCLYSTTERVEQLATESDLVIGAVLIPGAAAPKLLSAETIRRMRPGSVVVDVAIDQGGCFETSKPTTHQDPTYFVDGVVHYCVANMPGAVPVTSTDALNNATLPYGLALAGKGFRAAMANDAGLMNGLSVHAGQLTQAAVGEALGLESVDAASVVH